MKIVTGNIWNAFYSGKYDVFLFPSNGVIRNSAPPALVMGAGVARAVRNSFSGIDIAFAEIIKRRGTQENGVWKYGVVVSANKWGVSTFTRVGAFQSKLDWRDPSSLDILDYSVQRLCDALDMYPWKVMMPFPATGNGKLTQDQVLPVIERLPDNVHVYEAPKSDWSGVLSRVTRAKLFEED